ncbi:MAG: hypothetical protein IT385_24675 [Deltaproteobacteria bacterium]|nr:hypothetical protein [Deltaproteobacteria bacterium]
MIPQLVTVDLAHTLRVLRGVDGPAQEATTLLGTTVEVVGLPAGRAWEGPPDPADRLVIVMDGLGTIVVDDWRATVAPGVAVAVPARRRLAATADGRGRLELLVIGRAPEAPPALVAASDEPPEKSLGDDDSL